MLCVFCVSFSRWPRRFVEEVFEERKKRRSGPPEPRSRGSNRLQEPSTFFFFFLSTSFFFFFFLCRIDTRFLPTFIKNSLISSPLVATVSARDLPPHRYIRIGRQCFGRGRCEFEKAKPAPVAAVAASFLRQSKRSPIKARRAALSPLFSTATALSRCRRAIAVKSDR